MSDKITVNEKKKKTKNSLDRVMSASNSAFSFVPQTVLQLVENDHYMPPWELVNAINKRVSGGIGPFEIQLLDWINMLKYSTKAMLLDLIISGYISLGWRGKTNASKITETFNRLAKYDLIDLTRFVAVSEKGELLNDNRSIIRINSLGKTGYTLLKEMGRQPRKRDTFTVLADGNTVKRYLSANQWLIYWLSHYAEKDVLDYSTAQIINVIGSEWNGGRIYASVTMKNCVMIAEPLRRYEEFEVEKETQAMYKKFLRFVLMFDNLHQLYTAAREPLTYPMRPIITYVCEDEAHMQEMAELLKSFMKEHTRQEVWFTTDQRIFNYEMAGKRFTRMDFEKEILVEVDLEAKVGVKEMTMEERGGIYKLIQ